MTIAADEPRRQGFRPSQLLYDSRYRSLTIQVVTLVLLAALLFWLVRNVVVNLSVLGKDFDFTFLGRRAGYDIGQTLVPYTNNDTHARAALVGILNTLLVAGLGCVTATIIGVIAGVLRLSRNWLVGRLMTVYVEAFRNVPLLLWIIPRLRDPERVHARPHRLPTGRGRGARGGEALWPDRLHQPRHLHPLAGLGRGGLHAGHRGGAVHPGRPRLARLGAAAADGDGPAAAGALGDPCDPGRAVLVAFLALGRPLTFDIPTIRETGIARFNGGVNVLNSLVALWLALALYTGAFIAEIVRAASSRVPGQSEAAFALGLRPGRTMHLVILPQALRVIVPPLISQYLNLTKNTSLAVAVGYADVRATLGGVTMNQTGASSRASCSSGSSTSS
jgi:general L-amino acid transport system permease protein